VKRLVGLLRSRTKQFAAVPGSWWRKLPEDAPLLHAARWKREIAALEAGDIHLCGRPFRWHHGEFVATLRYLSTLPGSGPYHRNPAWRDSREDRLVDV
jgi:hypothetical protein